MEKMTVGVFLGGTAEQQKRWLKDNPEAAKKLMTSDGMMSVIRLLHSPPVALPSFDVPEPIKVTKEQREAFMVKMEQRILGPYLKQLEKVKSQIDQLSAILDARQLPKEKAKPVVH